MEQAQTVKDHAQGAEWEIVEPEVEVGQKVEATLI
jgi:hypothetical protein